MHGEAFIGAATQHPAHHRGCGTLWFASGWMSPLRKYLPSVDAPHLSAQTALAPVDGPEPSASPQRRHGPLQHAADLRGRPGLARQGLHRQEHARLRRRDEGQPPVAGRWLQGDRHPRCQDPSGRRLGLQAQVRRSAPSNLPRRRQPREFLAVLGAEVQPAKRLD